MDICNICCNQYNNSTRKVIECPIDSCKYKSCKQCVRTYILNTSEEPHCMNCKNSWTQKFIIENTNKSFYDNDFKKYKKEILLNIELTKLPESMQAAENYLYIKEQQDEKQKIQTTINNLNKELLNLKKLRYDCIRNINIIQSGNIDQDKKKFIMPCPNNDCRGYLSTQYKCELCKLYTCPTCFEVIGYNKNDEHVCNQDSVKSAELIKKDTKPCPKCGVRIYKISGCNQMWCTECKVAFDWTSSKIVNGNIHNPHYYEWLKKQNNGTIPRNPDDIVCGGLYGYNTLKNKVIYRLNLNHIKNGIEYFRDFWNCLNYDFINNHPLILELSYNSTLDLFNDSGAWFKYILDYITKIHRFINHFNNENLRNTRNKVQELQDNESLRVAYINKLKSKEEFANNIFMKFNQKKKYSELLHIYELISAVGIDLFTFIRNISNIINKDNYKESIIKILDKIQEYINLIKYCNKEFANISTIFNNKVLYITLDSFAIKVIKYITSDINYIDFIHKKFNNASESIKKEYDYSSYITLIRNQKYNNNEASCSYH